MRNNKAENTDDGDAHAENAVRDTDDFCGLSGHNDITAWFDDLSRDGDLRRAREEPGADERDKECAHEAQTRFANEEQCGKQEKRRPPECFSPWRKQRNAALFRNA